jgi:formiminoglutamase
MPNTSMTQSQKRFNESLGALFNQPKTPKQCLFLKSSSDEGVIRNGGRNGARFAPNAFMNVFKKFTQSPSLSQFGFAEIEVADADLEVSHFNAAQIKESEKIRDALLSSPDALIHLGGGHDHAFALVKALQVKNRPIVIINIDAHADTRDDELAHSGTPFKQLALQDIHLYQIGLHPFTNSHSTLAHPMSILWKSEISEQALNNFFSTIKEQSPENALYILSIDADGLDGAFIQGVSAVNADGLGMHELTLVGKLYRQLQKDGPIVGIYELNPLYDNLSSLSMKRMAAFVYSLLE